MFSGPRGSEIKFPFIKTLVRTSQNKPQNLFRLFIIYLVMQNESRLIFQLKRDFEIFVSFSLTLALNNEKWPLKAKQNLIQANVQTHMPSR